MKRVQFDAIIFPCELCESIVPLWLIYITFMLVRGGNGCFATRMDADFLTTQILTTLKKLI